MNRKGLFITLFTIFIIAILGYFVLMENRTVIAQTQQAIFVSKEECEQKTGQSCTFQMCDYVPAGKTFEEVCGKDFKKGWVPIVEPKPVPFEEIILHRDWRLKPTFNYSTYKGIFRNKDELKKVWAYMVNAWDEQRVFWEKKHENQPIMPTIDYNKYSVIWYADRGSKASFVTINKLIEYNNVIEAHVTLFYSDFGSSHLNLWTIPKTDKEIRFVETREYEERGS